MDRDVSDKSCATPSGASVLNSVETLPSSPVRSQHSTCRSDGGSVGSFSFSVFLICSQWLHTCLLAGVSPLRSIFYPFLFSWLPSPRKIRHRRRQYWGYFNQLALRRGACGRSSCLESRFHGQTFLAPFPLLVQLSDSPGFDFFRSFSLFLLPGCWSPALNFPAHPCLLSAPALLVPVPVLVALRSHPDLFHCVSPGSTHFFNMSSTFSVCSDLASDPWESSLAFRDLSPFVTPLGSFGQTLVPLCTDAVSCYRCFLGSVLLSHNEHWTVPGSRQPGSLCCLGFPGLACLSLSRGSVLLWSSCPLG